MLNAKGIVMRILIVGLLTLISFTITFAQKSGRPLIDSLYQELNKTKTDTVRVRLLSTICYELRNINPRDAQKPGQDALVLAEKINFEYGQGLAQFSLTYIYHILSRLPESIDHALKAQAIFEHTGDKNYLCATYLMLAYLYKDLDKDITRDYMQKATALLPDVRSVLWKARNFGTLGNNYRNLGQFDSAEKYMRIHLKIAEENHLQGEIMVVKNRFGYLYMAQSKLDTAFELIKSGLEYFKSIGSTRMVAENSTTLGKIRLKQSQEAGSFKQKYLAEAEAFALEGLSASCDLGYIIQRYTACKLLSDIYTAKGKDDMALSFLKAAFNDYDSIYGAQVVSRASFLSWKNEEALKEKQVELLKLRNRQQLVIIFTAVFGIIILFIVVLNIINSKKRLRKAYLVENRQKEKISRVLSELEATNQELEAFSYSVSHDLRAPVRRIESLCGFLSDDYTDLIDDSGKDILRHISDSTTLMNRLIEDLLKLSRITRQTLMMAPCNISEMSERIFSDLRLTYPERLVNCRIEPNIIVQGDVRLLQIAMQNLLDNAWKYSSRTEHPEIIVGSEERENNKFIFIRDNGVGFDMALAGNLFTPFQRLHSEEYFKGTGIGLATVKRIIVKHGGTISAQSEPGKGTTFSFTLYNETALFKSGSK